MKRGTAVLCLAAISTACILAASTWGMYNPTTGRFMQRDPVEYVDGANLYQYLGSNPSGATDPSGELQRRQVSWLARNYLRQQDWNIDAASPYDVKAKVIAAKKRLRTDFPGARFTLGDAWTNADDQALQKVLDGRPEGDKSIWTSFPGQTFTPLDAKQAAKAVRTAMEKLKELGGTMCLDENTLLAWAMKESSWNPYASAYGSSASTYQPKISPISTAVGFLQLTQGCVEGYAAQGALGENPPQPAWDEAALSNPVVNMVVALLILEKTPGQTLAQKLSAYRTSTKPQTGAAYASSVFKGKRFLDDFLKRVGKPIDQLNDDESKELFEGLDRSVR